MSIQRRQVGSTELYHGRKLTARYLGPDLLAYVDDVELNAFYTDVESARAAGRRHVDAEIKEEEKRRSRQA